MPRQIQTLFDRRETTMALEVNAEQLKDTEVFERYVRLIALDHAQRTSAPDDRVFRIREIIDLAKEYQAFLKGE